MARGAGLVAGGLVVAALAAGCGGVSRVSQAVVCNGPPPGSPMTLAHPLPCFAKRTTLARAAALAGVRVVLPDTPLLRASDAGAVWIDGFSHRDGRKTMGVVAVTFPAQKVIVEYTVPYSLHARTHYQAMAKGLPGSEVVSLKGKAALVIRQKPDRHNFGVITFKRNDTEIRILDHGDQAALKDLALSILSQPPRSRSTA
jgi:hypothetical protein